MESMLSLSRKSKLLAALFAAFFFSGCEAEKKKSPVSPPLVPNTPTVPSPEPSEQEPGDDSDDASVDPEDPVPTFSVIPRPSYRLSEGEILAFSVTAVAFDGTQVAYGLDCDFRCPEGLTVSAGGALYWEVPFDAAGLYELRLFAADSAGRIAYSPGFVVEVLDVNRPPNILSVEIVPDDPTSPSSLSCYVTKNDPDFDLSETKRVWIIDGVASPVLSSRTISTSTLLSGMSITCEVFAVDSKGLAGNTLSSSPFVLPNKAPRILSVTLVNRDTGNGVFRVGDRVTCPHSADDPDPFDTAARTETVLKKHPSGDFVARVSGNADLDYQITRGEAHQSLVCSVFVSDGKALVSRDSLAVTVANSKPVIGSVTFVSETGGPLYSGEKILCSTAFTDPDGDAVIPTLTFFNASISRGSGTSELYDAESTSRSYRLVTAQQTSQTANADIYQDAMSCRVSVSDIHGGSETLDSDPIFVQDSPPTLTLSQGSLEQTIHTSERIENVILASVDRDGHALSIVKTQDTCSGVGLTVSLPDSFGVVSSTPLPSASFPHADRDCAVTYKATTPHADSSELTLVINAPNRAPVLSCTNSVDSSQEEFPVVRTLATGLESYSRTLMSLGQELGRDLLGNISPATSVVCTVSDPDGTLSGAGVPPGGIAGDSFGFTLVRDVGGSSCSLAPNFDASDEIRLLPSSPVSRTVVGAMGLERCVSEIAAFDGDTGGSGRLSNSVEIVLEPAIEAKFASNFTLDNACAVTQNLALSYGPGITMGTPQVAASFVGGAVDAGSTRADENFLEYYISQDVLEASGPVASPGAGITANVSFLGDSDLGTSLRTISRIWDVAVIPSLASSANPQRPRAVFGMDAAVGRQVASGQECVRESSCSGRRSAIAVGHDHACVLGTSGEILCWGKNDKRQLGLQPPNDLTNFDTAQISNGGMSTIDDDTTATSVVAGAAHTCVLTASQGVKCWGQGFYGELGRTEDAASGSYSAQWVVDEESNPLTGIVQIASGASHSCAVRSDETLYCWGDNTQTQVGRTLDETPACAGGRKCYKHAVKVPSLSGVVGVSAGGAATCAVLRDRSVFCFGEGAHGQLALADLPSPLDYETPRESLSAYGSESAALGFTHSCFIYKNGRVACSGVGQSGELGSGMLGDTEEVDHASPAYASGAAAVALGDRFSCFVTSDRHVECVGRNDAAPGSGGILGSPSAPPGFSTSKVRVETAPGASLAGVIALSSGKDSTCAVTDASRVYCWGGGAHGKLGHGASPVTSNLAVEVPGVVPARRSCTEAFELSIRN